MLKSFSVLLLYPDYVTDSFGETYYDFVRAKNRDDAVRIARKRCIDTNGLSLDSPTDLAEVLVTEGHNRGV